MINIKKLPIRCVDGFELIGSLYEPKDVRAAIMIAPATGIKRSFYHTFANYLKAHDYAVLTFDNRGIGDSINGDLNRCDASLVNWGQLDMTAVLNSLKQLYPDMPYHLIGHSAGGQLAGLMSNAHDLTSMFNVGCSSGSLKYAKYPFKLMSSFWLNIYIPFNNFLFKHTKSHWVGMGEPLPKRVGQEWRRWCNAKGYIKVDLDKRISQHLYHDLSLPSMWLHAADDDIANDDTVKDMIRVFKKIDAEVIKINPNDYGYKDIGHMKFFSSKRQALWHHALTWLDKY